MFVWPQFLPGRPKSSWLGYTDVGSHVGKELQDSIGFSLPASYSCVTSVLSQPSDNAQLLGSKQVSGTQRRAPISGRAVYVRTMLRRGARFRDCRHVRGMVINGILSQMGHGSSD